MSYIHLRDRRARLVDLLAGDGLARDAGGHVGDHGNAQQRQTTVRRRQRLRYSRHPHGVAAEQADGANFGRRFKLRAGHEEIHALMHGKAELCRAGLRQLAQLRRVHPRNVKEAQAEFVHVPAPHGAGAVELDVVGDQHEIAARIGKIHAARRVRHDQRTDAEQLQKPHRLRQLLEIVALVAVKASREAHELLSGQLAEHQLSGVAGGRGNREIRDLVIVDLDGILKSFRKRPKR